ncbi:hypothetical protein AK966_13310 [Vibrio sp. PID23_8]|nr:hypothetical protein AK966_13310 [Vibrio sp. PID23_8]
MGTIVGTQSWSTLLIAHKVQYTVHGFIAARLDALTTANAVVSIKLDKLRATVHNLGFFSDT